MDILFATQITWYPVSYLPFWYFGTVGLPSHAKLDVIVHSLWIRRQKKTPANINIEIAGKFLCAISGEE
jgi:hypothetical protein